jgi:hypothetical protein
VQSITALSSHQPTGSRPRMQSTELPHLKCDCRRSQPRLNKKAGCKNWFLSITPLGSYFQVNLAKGCTMFPRCTHRPPPTSHPHYLTAKRKKVIADCYITVEKTILPTAKEGLRELPAPTPIVKLTPILYY